MSDNKSPWGNRPSGNGSGGKKNPWGQGGRPDRNRPRAGENSPDLDNVIQGFKDRVRGSGGGPRRSGGGNPNNPFSRFGPFGLFILIGLLFLIVSCFYTVKQQEEAVILRFGEYSRTTVSGLHLKLPTPIETVHKVIVTTQRPIESTKNLVLTGDENIADIDFTVRWNIKNSENYLFNLEDPDAVVEDAADSALREVIGKKSLESVITTERQPIEAEVKELLQGMLDQYNSGADVTVVQLQRAEAPPKVIKAFEDVVTAEQELEQRVNEGQAYLNQVTEAAKGEAAKIVEGAEAYKQEVVSVATGETDRFLAVYKEYKAAPQVTRQRIYLETIEQIYGGADKIILDEDAGSGVVPYLPLDQLTKKAGAN
jgi:membrane protease subunit HflK